jgi:hypothetical protein
MKKALVNNGVDAYLRYPKNSAKQTFELYGRIYIMPNDKDPCSDPALKHEYVRGEKCGLTDKNAVMSTFNDALNDYKKYSSENKITPRYKVKKELFSYWVKMF